MGPHWSGHGPSRERTEHSTGVSLGPAECVVGQKGHHCPNLMAGIIRLQAKKEDNAWGVSDSLPW